MYCDLNTAASVFLIFTTQLYQYSSVFFLLFALFSEEPEVFLPKYSQTVILHAAHFRRVVNLMRTTQSRIVKFLPVALTVREISKDMWSPK